MKYVETRQKLFQLFWIFMIGSFVGDIIETIYCYITVGAIMNRSSVLYGPFSLVWGMGAVLMSMLAFMLRCLHVRLYAPHNLLFLFLLGMAVGGLYEYGCSLYTEILFGTIYWDYSHMPWNFEGRTSLLFSFYWGLLTVGWVCLLHPLLTYLLEKCSWRVIKPLTLFAAIFMVLNIYLSTCSLIRYTERYHGHKASSAYETFLDRHYPDEMITRLYPEMKVVD